MYCEHTRFTSPNNQVQSQSHSSEGALNSLEEVTNECFLN